MKRIVVYLMTLALALCFIAKPALALDCTTFGGIWIDVDGTIITIEEENNIISVEYSNGRGPFPGFEVSLYTPVISVDFRDVDVQLTGLLVGNQIKWPNQGIWTRKN